MFEREYVLVSFNWTDRAAMSSAINTVIRSHDHDRASASIACMSNDPDQLHVLIEKWTEDGDTEQDTTRSVDAAPKTRKPRRRRTSQNNDAGTAPRVEPESVNLPLE